MSLLLQKNEEYVQILVRLRSAYLRQKVANQEVTQLEERASELEQHLSGFAAGIEQAAKDESGKMPEKSDT